MVKGHIDDMNRILIAIIPIGRDLNGILSYIH